MKFSKKHSVKIPKNIKIIYYAQPNFLVIIGPSSRKVLNLKLRVIITEPTNYIAITTIPTRKVSDNRKKNIKSLTWYNNCCNKAVYIRDFGIVEQKN